MPKQIKQTNKISSRLIHDKVDEWSLIIGTNRKEQNNPTNKYVLINNVLCCAYNVTAILIRMTFSHLESCLDCMEAKFNPQQIVWKYKSSKLFEKCFFFPELYSSSLHIQTVSYLIAVNPVFPIRHISHRGEVCYLTTNCHRRRVQWGSKADRVLNRLHKTRKLRRNRTENRKLRKNSESAVLFQ